MHVFAALVLVLAPAVLAAQGPVFTRIADGVTVHTTYNRWEGKPFPSNGLLIETPDSVVLIDTGWGIKATKDVIRYVERTIRKPIAACIATHHHDDRTSGFPVLKKMGVPCLGTDSIRALALKRGDPVPDRSVGMDTVLMIDGVQVHYWHPGPGHTRDNMVVWLPAQRILFGGCLVKSTEAQGLGFTGDADQENWPATIQAVQRRFSDAVVVVPGHQAWGGTELLQHTLTLLHNGRDR